MFSMTDDFVFSPPTFQGVCGYQRRSQRTETVKCFSQQPLLPIALHLPVTCADVVGDGEPGHVGQSFFLLEKKKGRKTQVTLSAGNFADDG